MFRNMVTSLFRHGRITTTVPRAKELRRVADKMVTLAKDGSLHARRQALSVIMDKAVVAKLFTEIADQMMSRNGGYTRIVKIGPRRGDGAMMCIIELVRESIKPSGSKRKKAPAAAEEVAPTVIPEAKEEASAEPEQDTEVLEEKAGDSESESVSEKAEVSAENSESSDISEEEESTTDEIPGESETEQPVVEAVAEDLENAGADGVEARDLPDNAAEIEETEKKE